MWTGFNWLRLGSLMGSREHWNNIQAASVLGICWSVERLSMSQNGKWSTMNTLLLMCCERLAYNTRCLMNKVVDFVFIHLSTIHGDGGKLREREREREREGGREKILRSKFSCPRLLIHGVHKTRTLVYADHATILWHLLHSNVTFTSVVQGFAGATKHNRRLQISSIPAKWARFLARPIPVNVTASVRKD
jgi:hypothetical protein